MHTIRLVYLTCILLVLSSPGLASVPNYSIDSSSPETPTPYSPLDIINYFGNVTDPPSVFGLSSGDLIAYSFGTDLVEDQLNSLNQFHYYLLYYSVSRGSAGVIGTPVWEQVFLNGAAGDIFRADVWGGGTYYPPPLGSQYLQFDAASSLGLTPTPGESNIDGLCHTITPAVRLYFVTNNDPANIYFTFRNGSPSVYASTAALLLVPGDVIDALSVYDAPPVGSLTSDDIIWASLASGSPSLATASVALAPAGLIYNATGGDVFQLYPPSYPQPPLPPGPFKVRVWAGAAFGLLATDDLDALTIKFAGPDQIPTLSTWSIVVLVVFMLMIGFLLINRKKRSMAER